MKTKKLPQDREAAFHAAIVEGGQENRYFYADWLEEQGRPEEAARQRGHAGEFVQKLKFIPAFDKRDSDNGIHGAELRMVLIGPAGAVQFVLYTNWHLPDVQVEMIRRATENADPRMLLPLLGPMPADLGYHAKRPQYEEHPVIDNDCPYTGGPCYYNGSGLRARGVFDLLVTEGGEAVWKFLQEYYQEVFGL